MEITKNNHKEQINIENLITIPNLAKEWKVNRVTIYNWLKKGSIKQVDYLGVKFIDKSTYVPVLPKGLAEALAKENSEKTA